MIKVKAINHALGTLGFKDLISDVRVGKQIIIELNSNDKEKKKKKLQKCVKNFLLIL